MTENLEQELGRRLAVAEQLCWTLREACLEAVVALKRYEAADTPARKQLKATLDSTAEWFTREDAGHVGWKVGLERVGDDA